MFSDGEIPVLTMLLSTVQHRPSQRSSVVFYWERNPEKPSTVFQRGDESGDEPTYWEIKGSG